MEFRTVLINVYLEWVNNYISPSKFAEHHGLTVAEAIALINLSREVSEHPHPEV